MSDDSGRNDDGGQAAGDAAAGPARGEGAPVPSESETERRSIEDRLAAVERAVGELAASVRTRQVEVVDDHGVPRIVAAVVDGHAEVRVTLAHPRPEHDASVVIYATPDPGGLGAGVGVQLWAAGDAVAELNAWPYDGRQWRAGLHIEEGEH